ncbi:MAG: signal recognition particle-docking protein FtsY [Ignavibacteriaceae bacterium]
MNLFKNFNLDKLKDGLSKTRAKLLNSLNETISGKAFIEEDFLEKLEEILISSDIGFDVANKIINQTRIKLKNEKDRSDTNIIRIVKEKLITIFDYENYSPNEIIDLKIKPYVILIIGVNGVGKTTTIGKLANNIRNSGLEVIVGAADTFRAAASEQLNVWAERAKVKIVQKPGGDPSSVAFEAITIALEEHKDVVIIDTAGRLHNKSNLMEELNKIKRVISKKIPNAPHETLLVLDGNTGQNAIMQTEEFSKVTNITGLVVTKLDGTAKGGVIFQICDKLKIPVKYIGVGEGIDDLQNFDPKAFVSAIFEN